MTKLALGAALAASLSFLAVSPASAQDVHVQVSYADLNLSSATGARTLAQRVFEAACVRPDVFNLRNQAKWQECKENARNSAMEQLNGQNVPFDSDAFIAA
jgi:UrcA family protein